MFRRRRTVTPEMRAAFARQMAEAPSHEAVMAGLNRVSSSLMPLAAVAPQKRRYAESGAAHELEFYGDRLPTFRLTSPPGFMPAGTKLTITPNIPGGDS